MGDVEDILHHLAGRRCMWVPYAPVVRRRTYTCTGVASQIRRRSCRRTPETGVYFTQPPRRNPAARVLVPGSGMTKPSKRTFKAPAHLTQHRAAARRSAPPHDDPSATGRALRHGAGIRPPEGRHVPSAHIRARLAPVLYRSSFVVVVSGQWCTHCDTRDNRRLVAIKTAFAR